MNIKVLHIPLILFFLLPIFNISADETWEDLPEDPDTSFTVGTAESGCEVLIFYGEGKTSLTKPVIFVEGIDLANKFGWDSHYAKVNPETGEKEGILFQQNIVYRILQEGYDFVFVNFNDSLLDLETNGDNLILVIEEINRRKASSADNVVLGASMGGVVARYALAKMENQGKDHDTRLFVSLDAPQQGAYMPPSISLFLYRTKRELGGDTPGEIKDNIAQIESDACLQLFIANIMMDGYDFSLDSEKHETFFNDLIDMAPSEMGYPNKLRKIAISNGSGNGNKQYPSLEQDDLIFSATIRVRVWIWILFPVTWTKYFVHLSVYNMTDENFPLPVDLSYRSQDDTDIVNEIGLLNAPGSSMPLFKTVQDALEKEDSWSMEAVVAIADVDINTSFPVKNTSFITTVSALDLRDPGTGEPLHPFSNLSADTHIKDKTVFDDIHWEPDNNQHDTYLSAEAAQFILDNIFQTAEMSVIYNLLLSD